ncbi:hypothetical protein [Nocardia anaemiae]|uniref:hypothetical protein n=1 Tax=Nocardia anaemiae TaxID=263910 RepID=UPI0007A3DD6E|nr:hypothetical protein [Nocardia anaemiae]
MLREFERKLEQADAEPEPAERARRIVATIHEFLALGEDRELSAERVRLFARADEVAELAPDAAVRLFARLTGFFGLHESRAHLVLTAWLNAPEATTFAQTWAAANEILSESQDLAVWLSNTVRAAGAGVAPEFLTLARTHLVELVDADFRAYEFSGATSPVWMLMSALGPSNRPDWFLHFGDRAAERGDEAEAARRYELADRFGAGDRARNRLRRLYDLAAYHRLRQGITTPDKVKGPGTPSPYRHLALATAAVMDGRSPTASLTEVIRHGGRDLQPLAKFLAALTCLRAGDRDTTHAQLRELSAALSESPVLDEDVALGANVRLVLGALEEDDELIVSGARELVRRFGAGWPELSMVEAATVLTAVARRDARLLPELLGSGNLHDAGGRLDRLRIDTARDYLAKAARATVFSRSDEADELIARTRQLLAGAGGADADELRTTATHIADTAARLRDIAAPERPLDRLAYAALRADGVVQPWTDTALRLWRDHAAEDRGEADSHSLHHLAIAEHARAYQLEIAGDDGAFESWRQGHAAWARVWADDRFWERLRTRLKAVAADSTPEEVARVVGEARGELPAQVLEPHVTRVQELRRDQLPRARAHLDLIRTAPFAPADIARARGRLAREAGVQIRRLSREGQHDRALHEAQAWIEIDPDNIPLAEQALDVGIEVVETEHRRGEDWAERSRPSLERIAALVEPLCSELGLTARQLNTRGRPSTDDQDQLAFAAKLARHEFWLGAATLVSTIDRTQANPYADRTGFRTALEHFKTALTLGVPAIAPYSSARELLVAAGKWERATQGGSVVGFF